MKNILSAAQLYIEFLIVRCWWSPCITTSSSQFWTFTAICNILYPSYVIFFFINWSVFAERAALLFSGSRMLEMSKELLETEP